MSFTTPCFVKVEDSAKRQELIKWLEGIGYKCLCSRTSHGGEYIIAGNVYYRQEIVQLNVLQEPYAPMVTDDAINCKKSIELFKALAAMRDDTDDGQLFTDGRNWAVFRVCCYPEGTGWEPDSGLEFSYLPDNVDYSKFRKATVEEIINKFK